jgi:hypothetical protein
MEERKNKALLILLVLLQMEGVFFFGLALYGLILFSFKQTFYLLGRIGLFPISVCAFFFILLELGFGLILSYYQDKKMKGAFYLLLVPFIILMFVAGILEPGDQTYEKKFASFDASLVVVSHHTFFSEKSEIYTRTSFFSLSYITSVGNSENVTPLQQERNYSFESYPHGVGVFDISSGKKDESDEDNLYFRYVNGLFLQVDHLSEIE